MGLQKIIKILCTVCLASIALGFTTALDDMDLPEDRGLTLYVIVIQLSSIMLLWQ